METYWRTGSRILSLPAISTDRLPVVRLLLDSQIIIATLQNRVTGEAQEVGFFHDSMPSLLTASGLFKLPDAWNQLERAAGDPLFTKGRPEIFGETGSELFQMCLAVQ